MWENNFKPCVVKREKIRQELDNVCQINIPATLLWEMNGFICLTSSTLQDTLVDPLLWPHYKQPSFDQTRGEVINDMCCICRNCLLTLESSVRTPTLGLCTFVLSVWQHPMCSLCDTDTAGPHGNVWDVWWISLFTFSYIWPDVFAFFGTSYNFVSLSSACLLLCWWTTLLAVAVLTRKKGMQCFLLLCFLQVPIQPASYWYKSALCCVWDHRQTSSSLNTMCVMWWHYVFMMWLFCVAAVVQILLPGQHLQLWNKGRLSDVPVTLSCSGKHELWEAHMTNTLSQVEKKLTDFFFTFSEVSFQMFLLNYPQRKQLCVC